MKNDLTELVFILDKSGSMGGLEQDTIGGFNSMLARQKEQDGDCLVTTALFCDDYTLLHDRTDIRAVRPITGQDYLVGGSTALFDAIGNTIDKIAAAQRNTAEDYRAKNVVFVIITDGCENSSRKYSSKRVKALIERQKDEFGWEFIFLGANIDAVETAGSFGIAPDRAQNYHADGAGVELNFRVMSDAVATFRECSSMPDDWNAEIQADFSSRGMGERDSRDKS